MSIRDKAIEVSATGQLPLSTRGKALLGQEMFKVLERARRLEEEGARICHLELGNPRFQPPGEIIEACVKALKDGDFGYTSSAGLPALRQAVAERYARLTQRNLTLDNVIVSPANLIISQFLDLTCDQSDRIVVFTPAFPSYLVAAAHIGLETIELPLSQASGFDLTDADIDQAVSIRPKAILVNSANNPTGAVYSMEQLRRLALRCHEYGIWLLSDETYGEMCFGKKFYSLAALDLPQLVVMSSFSKIFSIPGFRTGFAIAHPAVAEKFAFSSSTLISCLPSFTQRGCLAGMAVLDSYLVKVREYFSRQAYECVELVNGSGVLSCAPPQSGFYLFVDIARTGLDDVQFSTKLLEDRHTAVTPGRSFGRVYQTSVRVATCGKYEDVLLGTERMVALAQELCPQEHERRAY